MMFRELSGGRRPRRAGAREGLGRQEDPSSRLWLDIWRHLLPDPGYGSGRRSGLGQTSRWALQARIVLRAGPGPHSTQGQGDGSGQRPTITWGLTFGVMWWGWPVL